MFFIRYYKDRAVQHYSAAYATYNGATTTAYEYNARVDERLNAYAEVVPFPVILTPASLREQRYAFSGVEADAAMCIGHLRADFGRSGNCFYTSWFDHKNVELKTCEFKAEFDIVINELRANGGPFVSRKTAREFNRGNTQAEAHPYYRDSNCHIYRFDSHDYAYIVRLDPREGDYDLYVYCYVKELLDAALVEDAKLTVYQRLQRAGVPAEELDHHESDLYVKASNRSDLAVREWLDANHYSYGIMVKPFVDQISGQNWLDVAFAYDPWWENKLKNHYKEE